MGDYESLSHSKWECKYHVVFIPKCRRKTLYVELRRHLGDVFRKLAEQKESKIEEGHLLPDHVHMLISIPPKHAVSQVIGFIKGKSAIHLARVYGEKKRNFVGQHFWARGYFVSTVGRDTEVIREYIKKQEAQQAAANDGPGQELRRRWRGGRALRETDAQQIGRYATDGAAMKKAKGKTKGEGDEAQGVADPEGLSFGDAVLERARRRRGDRVLQEGVRCEGDHAHARPEWQHRPCRDRDRRFAHHARRRVSGDRFHEPCRARRYHGDDPSLRAGRRQDYAARDGGGRHGRAAR